ncbi:MAG TPA: hypothetical protein VFN00_04385 [Arthrobacter sp.]|nr:hypothetical protein [Arthrobacter sp.]
MHPRSATVTGRLRLRHGAGLLRFHAAALVHGTGFVTGFTFRFDAVVHAPA